LLSINFTNTAELGEQLEYSYYMCKKIWALGTHPHGG